MKRVILSLCFVTLLALSINANATSYTVYVDSGITDVNVGSWDDDYSTYNPTTGSTSTGSSSVYKSLRDVNAFIVHLGSSVFFSNYRFNWHEY